MASKMAALSEHCDDENMQDEYLEMARIWRSLEADAAKNEAVTGKLTASEPRLRILWPSTAI